MTPHGPSQIQLSAHCLLRLATALMLEAQGIDHGFPAARQELNELSGRCYSASRWLQILEPAYCQRFAPAPRA